MFRRIVSRSHFVGERVAPFVMLRNSLLMFASVNDFALDSPESDDLRHIGDLSLDSYVESVKVKREPCGGTIKHSDCAVMR